MKNFDYNGIRFTKTSTQWSSDELICTTYWKSECGKFEICHMCHEGIDLDQVTAYLPSEGAPPLCGYASHGNEALEDTFSAAMKDLEKVIRKARRHLNKALLSLEEQPVYTGQYDMGISLNEPEPCVALCEAWGGVAIPEEGSAHDSALRELHKVHTFRLRVRAYKDGKVRYTTLRGA